MHAPLPQAATADTRRGAWRGRALAFAAGLLAALGFLGDGFVIPRPLLAPFLLVGLAALCWLCARAPARAAGLGWFWGWGHFSLGLIWIAEAFQFQAKMPAALGYVTVAGLAALLAIFPAFACWAAFRASRSPPARPFVFAAAWMLGEWVRVWLFSGFPWNPLAQAALFQFSPGLARVSALIGATGLSGLLALAAAGLALARGWPLLRLVGVVAAIPVLGFLVNALAPTAPPPAQAVEVRIVQPNIGQDEKWADGAPTAALARLVRNSQAGEPPRPGVPRLILWPEVALPRADLARDEALRGYLASLLRPGDLLLTGGLSAEFSPAGEPVAARNSLFAIDHRGAILGRFDKFHLVPGGEYVPLRPVADALGLSRLAPGALDFTAGPGPRTLPLPGLPPVGPLICYEIIFPGRIVDRANRPQWLLNPSNDAWFGSVGPPQALAIARLRAIEEGLPVARSTPTGVSALIDGQGRLLAALPQRAEGAVAADLPAPLAPTPFARFGHLTTALFGLVLLGAGWLAGRRHT